MKRVTLAVLILSICILALGILSGCGPSPVGIIVKSAPKNKTVPQGGTPDLTGGVVTVTYEDDTTKDVPMSELEQRGLNSAELGKQTLVLVYTEGKKSFSTTVEMTVSLAKATKLELATDNVKTSYFSGDNFDRTGLVVTAHYETGKVAEVTNYEISPTRLTADTAEVVVSYRSARASIPVTVVDKAPASLKFDSMPQKTTYFMGDMFSAEGLKATVAFNDGTTQSFNWNELSYSHVIGGTEYRSPDFLADSVVIVTATTALGTISAELTINVSEVLPVELVATVTEGELSFIEGEYFSFGGKGNVSIFVRYNNNTSETLVATDDLFFSDGEHLQAGQTSVKVTFGAYDAVKATIPVTVARNLPTAIDVLIAPKSTYAVGESVSLDGLILLATMTNGTFDQIPYSADGGFACTPTVVSSDTHRITVTYAGLETFFTIEVE